jgi:hypothetical protein
MTIFVVNYTKKIWKIKLSSFWNQQQTQAVANETKLPIVLLHKLTTQKITHY